MATRTTTTTQSSASTKQQQHTSTKQVVIFTSRKSITCVYAFFFTFLAFTTTLLFVNPSRLNSLTLSSSSTSSSSSSYYSYRSQLSFLFSHFFTNSSSHDTIFQLSRDSHFSRKVDAQSQDLAPNYTVTDLHSDGSREDQLEVMKHCNIYDGRWVRDDSYPLYKPESCPYVDESFSCFLNGRPDGGYDKFRWQPKNCNIPRLDGRSMLELLRGKRLVFVGDSLNRNMWESLVCILTNSVEDRSRAFEVSGRNEFRSEGSYSFVFKDYNCSVEFFQSPFLVREWETQEENGPKRQTLRLDLIEEASVMYKDADILIFNTGHWWTHEKTSRGKGYYQEGDHIYDQMNVKVAFRKALCTWAKWVDTSINAGKTIIFFRGYSISHFGGGRWNAGGKCDSFTEMIKNEAYLKKYPSKMRIFESVMKDMKTPIYLLNITRLSAFRKDAHPSMYTKQNISEDERRSPLRYQDCSHWCLPGVPDIWNELLYAQLLRIQNQKTQQYKRQEEQQKQT